MTQEPEVRMMDELHRNREFKRQTDELLQQNSQRSMDGELKKNREFKRQTDDLLQQNSQRSMKKQDIVVSEEQLIKKPLKTDAMPSPLDSNYQPSEQGLPIQSQ